MTAQTRAGLRFGTAHFTSEQELAKAGLLHPQALHLGFTKTPMPAQITFDADTPLLVVGASGAGKLATHIAYQLHRPEHTVILDMKGELAAISVASQPYLNLFCFNPYGLHKDAPWFVPCHRYNPLDVVQAGSVSFYEDCMTVALNVINKPKGGGHGNSEHFWGKAVQITTCLLVCLKEHNASASLVDLFHVVGDLRGSGDSDDFTLLHYPAMKASAFTAVQHMADELLSKRDTAGAEYESIISTISNSLQILGSPALQMALSSPSDITPQAFCASDIANKLFIIIPAHLMEACAPIIRTIFASVTIAQQRSPTRRLHLLIDEAGQLGHFEALLRLFSFGRGSKTRVSAIFQNVGQPMQHYGRDGFDTLFGNAQTKLFLGISSEATARYVSDYLGKQTYQYHAKSKQAAAFARQHTLLREMYSGGDVFKVLPELAKQRTLINTPESVSRPLMTPDELIHLPENEGILTIQGKGLRPYIYRKIPYFLNPSVAHHFLPNPFHAPFDRVKLPKGNGRFKTVHVITEDVPAAIAHKPQYQRGQWSYPKGYRPKLPRKKWFGLF